MDLLIFGLFILGGGLLIKYLGQQVGTAQFKSMACSLHNWRYFSATGWLDSEASDEARRGARLRCTQCLQYPNQPTVSKEPDYE